ncbi:HD-GYP domain-containing protein [Thalassobacillus sp. CUG 92003]|uniref:HD-GYP domain-containing protein n=1 Tax=Thalassobacillus sp. CUG 92003 TaxID=2736641 RepID=UPI0015E64D53|nr:HD-GYP domain-containing protein [Thalassobacillus sp. CUG 92003]
MRLHPSELVPGCIVTKDVLGQTNRPIISKNTVLKDIHINVLHNFMINEVEVSSTLATGSSYTRPKRQEATEPVPSEEEEEDALDPFSERYLKAVQQYNKWFQNWQNGAPIVIHEVRRVMVPLLEEAVHSKRGMFMLHHYATEEDYPSHHSVATGLISAFLGYQMNLSEGEWIQLGLAGVLSDAGMARIGSSPLHKKGALTAREYEEVKKHPTYSYRMVEEISSLNNGAKLGILQHHERLDGSGYPLGMSGEKLHLFSRIIAAADMYHAMTSERIYRAKQSPFKVLEQVLQEQFGRFDPKVIQVFVKGMTDYATGTKVRLSNHQEGEIVFIDSSYPTRPMIKLHHSGDIIHMNDYPKLYIEEILD